MLAVQQQFPDLIEIRVFEQGFIARCDESFIFYENFQNLAEAINPRVRKELIPLETCAGSC